MYEKYGNSISIGLSRSLQPFKQMQILQISKFHVFVVTASESRLRILLLTCYAISRVGYTSSECTVKAFITKTTGYIQIISSTIFSRCAVLKCKKQKKYDKQIYVNIILEQISTMCNQVLKAKRGFGQGTTNWLKLSNMVQQGTSTLITNYCA